VRPRRGRSALLAGFLLADLVLALVLIGLANLPAKPVTVPVDASASPAVVTSSAAPVVPGMSLPVVFRVGVKPASLRDRSGAAAAQRQMLSEVRSKLTELGLAGKQAGFVEVFATGSQDEIRTAVDTAVTVLQVLQQQEPAMFGKAQGDGYWGGEGDDLEFKIFFY
jgi:hypothetical protein